MMRGRRIPPGVVVLGLVSLLMDTSSELIHGLLPAFMSTVLGASALAIGAIEGVAEATALVVKVVSGPLSDYLGRRKPLAVLGYALGALSKPLFALATSPAFVLGARMIDRVGKGVRGAPRDALVADLAPVEARGAAFGLRQSLDTVGAFLGPVLAVALMLSWSNDIRAVFWVAVIPGALAVGLLVLGVREPKQPAERPRHHGGRRGARRPARHGLWLLQPDERPGDAPREHGGGARLGAPRRPVHLRRRGGVQRGDAAGDRDGSRGVAA